MMALQAYKDTSFSLNRVNMVAAPMSMCCSSLAHAKNCLAGKDSTILEGHVLGTGVHFQN